MTDEKAAWQARVAEYLKRLDERPGARDPEQLREATAAVAEEAFELVVGEVPKLTAIAAKAGIEAAALPDDQLALKRFRKAGKAAKAANNDRIRRLGAAWLAACFHGTDGDRRLLLLALGVDRPGADFAGPSLIAALRSIGLSPNAAARKAALAVLRELDVDLQPLDEEAEGEVREMLGRRFHTAPTTTSMH